MKGDMRMLEVMPSDALAAGATIVGTGATPEGIDQNPAYYEYTFDTAWNPTAQPLDGWFASYASRRYGNTANADAAAAWKILSTAVSTITCKPTAVSPSCAVTLNGAAFHRCTTHKRADGTTTRVWSGAAADQCIAIYLAVC